MKRWGLLGLASLVLVLLLPAAQAVNYEVLATTEADWNSWNNSTSGLTNAVAATGGYDNDNGDAWIAGGLNGTGWAQRNTTIDLSDYDVVYLYLWRYFDGTDFDSDHVFTISINGTEVARQDEPISMSLQVLSFDATEYGNSNVSIRYDDTESALESHIGFEYDYLVASTYLTNVTVRDEMTNETISTATVRAMNNTTAITNTTDADGLTQLLLDRDIYITDATATSYYNRTVLIDLVGAFGDYTIWLPNTSVDVVFCTFRLYDFSGDFPTSSTRLTITKPINNSSSTVYSNYFDALSECGAYLVHNDHYQLTVQSGDTTHSLGWFSPTDTKTYNLYVGSIDIEEPEGETVSYDITSSSGANNITVTLEYETVVGSTWYTNFSIYNESLGLLYESSGNTSSGSYTHTANETGVWVGFFARNSANNTTIMEWVGEISEPVTPVSELPDWAKGIIAVGLIIFAVLLFAELHVGAGLMMGSGMAAVFTVWDWINISELVLVSLFFITFLVIIKRRGS